MQVEPIDEDVSIGEGGPLRRFERRCHLTALHWQIAAALLVTWVPIVALGLVSEYISGSRIPLLHDTAMHVRLIIVTPVLLILDRVFPFTCRFAMSQLKRFGVIPPSEQPRYDRIVRSAQRLGDSWIPEGILALCALGLGVAAMFQFMPKPAFYAGRSEALAWYALVALPLFEFLLFRSLWRWFVWARVVVGLAHLKLDLEPTHPDRRGGLSFLRVPSIHYCGTLLFATTSVLCAEWGARFPHGVTVMSFAPVLLAFATVGTLIAFGPLLLFVPQLVHARLDGLARVGSAAAHAGRAFRIRWDDQTAREVLASSDVQSLAAVLSTYRDTVAQMRLLLFEKRDFWVVLLATLTPVLPLMLLRVPKEDWLSVVGLFGLTP